MRGELPGVEEEAEKEGYGGHDEPSGDDTSGDDRQVAPSEVAGS
jgi:hypothetical protein